MIILIDIDDTINCLCASWCNWLNSRYGTAVNPKDITQWDISKFFPNLTKEQVYGPLHNEFFWTTVEPREDAVKYVKKLFDEGYDIYLCTSTDYRNVRVKYESIVSKYFAYIKWKNVIVAHNKQMIKADFLVDDGVHNLVGGDYTKILMAAPHNQNYDTRNEGIFRANDWEDVYNIITTLTGVS